MQKTDRQNGAAQSAKCECDLCRILQPRNRPNGEIKPPGVSETPSTASGHAVDTGKLPSVVVAFAGAAVLAGITLLSIWLASLSLSVN